MKLPNEHETVGLECPAMRRFEKSMMVGHYVGTVMFAMPYKDAGSRSNRGTM